MSTVLLRRTSRSGAAAGVDERDGGGPRSAAADDRDLIAEHDQRRERGELAGQRRDAGARGVDEPEVLDAVPTVAGHDAPVGQEVVVLEAEDPRRLGELGGQWGERGDGGCAVRARRRHRRMALDTVQVPPAAAVADEVQPAVRAPGRLKDALGGAAGDAPLRGEPSGGRQLRHPQLGAVPRHLRVVPAEPGEPPPVGAEARRRVEVVAAGHDAGRGRSVGRQQ